MSAIYIPATYETEASILEDGFVAITQTEPTGSKSEIFLSKEQAQAIFNHLRDLHIVI